MKSHSQELSTLLLPHQIIESSSLVVITLLKLVLMTHGSLTARTMNGIESERMLTTLPIKLQTLEHQSQEQMLDHVTMMVRFTCSVDMVVSAITESHSMISIVLILKPSNGINWFQPTLHQREEVDLVCSQVTTKSTFMVDGIRKCNTVTSSSST
jgi:hypothetical protein